MLTRIPDTTSKQLLTKIPVFAQTALTIVPFSLKAKIIKDLLNILMKEQMEVHELDFLKERWVAIDVKDFNLQFEVSFNGKWLVRIPEKADVSFSADSRALIKVAAAKEDPDTLFFKGS